jgi:hypothetical protein
MIESNPMISPSSATAVRVPVPLRPLNTGELIDRGFSLYRANFAGLLLLSLTCQLAPLLASQALDSAVHLAPWRVGNPTGLGTHFMAGALTPIVWVLGEIAKFCFEVVMTIYLADSYLGQSPSIKTAFRKLRGKVVASAQTCLFIMVIVLFTFIFPLLTAGAAFFYWKLHPPESFMETVLFATVIVLGLVVSLVPMIVVLMRVMITVPAVAMENLGGWKAIQRSSELVRYDPGLGFFYWGETRLSLLLLPLFAIEFLAFFITATPLWLHEVNDILRHGSIGQITAPPESVVVLSQILVLLSSSLIFPLYIIAFTLFYYDVRIRREGFDLEFMAGRMGSVR